MSLESARPLESSPAQLLSWRWFFIVTEIKSVVSFFRRPPDGGESNKFKKARVLRAKWCVKATVILRTDTRGIGNNTVVVQKRDNRPLAAPLLIQQLGRLQISLAHWILVLRLWNFPLLPPFQHRPIDTALECDTN